MSSRPSSTATALFALVVGSGASGRVQAAEANLLGSAKSVTSSGASGLARMTDGAAPDEGAFWLTEVTARLGSSESNVTWDLGQVEEVRCAELQGDNNDFYHLLGSLDGESFFPMWTATPVEGAGMRLRSGKIVASTRFVRLNARGGDGMYAVGEVALFRRCPDPFPVTYKTVSGDPIADSARQTLLWFGGVLVAFVLFARRKNPRATLLMAVVPVGVGIYTAARLAPLYPLYQIYGNGDQTFEALLRAILAATAGALIFKEVYTRAAPPVRVRNGILGGLALLSFGSYYHFGAPQFWHADAGRRTYVHTFDLRHYAPIAKYFDELRFDGLYAGSFAAYLDLTGKSVDEVADLKFRDLRNAEMSHAGAMKDHIAEVKARFSPARWELFKSDMRSFLDIMGPGDYVGSMGDHGGNATPVWVLGAHAIMRNASFSERNLVLIGLIDPVLVALLFWGLWSTFGFRTAAYCAILFGATDFYQFGSNLMGSMLRQDWLVALGLGACAIRRGRFALGGALLAYGGLIRAFPAVATFFLVVPILWFVVDAMVRDKKLPALAELRTAQRAALRAIVGAAGCVAGLLIVSSAVFGLRASWGNWIQKISIHATDPSVNNVGLRNLMAFKPQNAAKYVLQNGQPEPWVEWQRLFYETLAERRILHLALIILAVAAIVLAARKRRLEQAAIIGLAIVPFVFYPSNYYCHYIFLLPLAAAALSGRNGIDEEPDTEARAFAWITLVLCALCIGQYFTLGEGWVDLRYTYQSALLLVGLIVALVPFIAANLRELFPMPVEETAAAPAGSAAAVPKETGATAPTGSDDDDDDDDD